MKRITALLGCFCLLVLFSCKKDVVNQPTPDFSQSVDNSLAITTINGVQTNTDTIPPSNAVDVRTYGAKGDGYTDDTKAIQNAINAQSVLVFKKGTYIINTTLNMRSNMKIYGTGGAAIKAGNAMSGKLLVNGRCIFINSCTNVNIINMTFLQSDKSYSLGTWGNSCIYILNSTKNTIVYNKFNYHQPYQHLGIEAVWVAGTGSNYNYILKNLVNTMGIEYGENGAIGTTVQGNTINKSFSTALSADGNVATAYCKNMVVTNNIINNAGYNGINDWGYVDGTVIRGNIITGTGKSPTEYAMGEGIQAVGVNTIVAGNTIIDAQAEYIECAGNDKLIDSNKIIDYNLKAEGIVVNTIPALAAKNARRFTTVLDHNSITGCLESVEIIGSVTPSVVVKNNTFINPRNTGVNVNANVPTYSLTITGNTFNFTTPSAGMRRAMVSYAANKTNTQKIYLGNNTFNYATSANGGAGRELAIATATNYVTVDGNIVNGNGIKSKTGAQVAAMDNAGVTYTGYTITNNRFNNCLYWLTGFLTILKTGNNF